jgi:hypothetical protein
MVKYSAVVEAIAERYNDVRNSTHRSSALPARVGHGDYVGDRSMKLPILLAAAILLSGCGPTHVVLQNPNTGEMAQCAGDAWANWNVYAATESCAKGYEASGYVRRSSY